MALDEYPKKGGKIDYERVTGVCKSFGRIRMTDDHFRQAAEGSAESSALLAQNAA